MGIFTGAIVVLIRTLLLAYRCTAGLITVSATGRLLRHNDGPVIANGVVSCRNCGEQECPDCHKHGDGYEVDSIFHLPFHAMRIR